MSYIFCIDTDSYAGNFSRQLCAYITGRIGECEVGAEEASLFEKDGLKPLWDVEDKPDEDGCHRPVTTLPSPGWFNDGFGNHWRDEDWGTEKVAVKYRQSIEARADQLVKIYAHLPDYGKKLAESFRFSYSELKPRRDQAYQTVGIYFAAEPSPEEIEFMKARAHKYMTDERIGSIEGFRLIQEEVVRTIKKV